MTIVEGRGHLEPLQLQVDHDQVTDGKRVLDDEHLKGWVSLCSQTPTPALVHARRFPVEVLWRAACEPP